ncbi:MAG: hypothetical protein N3D78_02850 [Candidatus Aenigmarchaeota archaeon]|nr:hypothetical protein [Candidatus Aenigmarchaeota archaeon]
MVKGISPLVATVLLIAITMTLAGILAFWGSGFVRTGLPTEEETQQFTRCSAALGSLKVDFQYYNSTTKNLILSIYNSGPEKLKLTNITFYYTNDITSKEINKEVAPGLTAPVILSEIESGYLKYIVYTDCPGVTLEGR